MKKNFCKTFGFAFVLTFIGIQLVSGQVKDNLQNALDNIAQTKADEITTIDLSKYSDLDRVHPLYVRNGVKVRFTNGTITRTASLKDSATIVIKDKSYLDLGNSCIISGGKMMTGHELILIDNGSLKLTSGIIKDFRGDSYATDILYQGSDWGILIKSSNGSFEMSGGSLTGGNSISNNGGAITFLGGEVIRGWIESNTDVFLYGNFNSQNCGFELSNKSKFIIKSALIHGLHINLSDEYFTDGCILAQGENYQLSDEDRSKIGFIQQWLMITTNFFNTHELLLKNNQIITHKKEIVDATTLQQAIDKAANGTESTPTVITIPTGGITLNGPITIPTGKHILITGGPITVKSFTGDWVFKISADATLVFKNIILDGGNCSIKYFFYIIGKLSVDSTCTIRNTSGYTYFYYITKTGISFIHGGTVTGATYGIWNEGKAYVYDGTFNKCKWAIYNTATGYLVTWKVTFVECTYRIYSYTCFWTRGDIDHGDIWIYKTVTIYVFTKITHQWTIHYIDGDLPGPDQTILSGSDDGAGSDPYKLGTGDVPPVFSDKWPGEKEPKFDTECGCYKPQTTTGTSTTVTTEAELQKAIENATGSCNGDPTTITINGTITIANGIVIKDKAIKLTGGKIIRSSTYLKDLISLQGACLTLENIDIDGNKDAFDNDSKVSGMIFGISSSLTINDGTKIHNHKSYTAIIMGENITINGGSIYDNYSAGNIIASESPVVMNGGSIYNNLSIDNVFWTVSFTMNGGTIEKNLTKYYTLSINKGTIKHPAIVRNNSGGITFLTTLTIEGDGSNISDPVTFESATSYIIRNAKHTSPLTISHNATSAKQLSAGTVVVQGTDNYQLTKSDLGYYSYTTTGWTLSLSGNTIVLKQNESDYITDPDDLQKKLDNLANSENKGTKKDPIDEPCGEIQLGNSKTIHVPDYVFICLLDGSMRRKDDGSGLAKRIIDIPSTSYVKLSNMTIDGSNLKGDEPLLVVGGILKVDSGSVIKGGNNTTNNNGSGVYTGTTGKIEITGGEISGNTGNEGGAVVNLGTFTMSGGTISGNSSTANVANGNNSTFIMTGGSIKNNKASGYCGGVYFGENVDATLSGGEISGNDFSDVYSWSNLKLSGAMKLSIMALVNPAKMLVTSALKNNFKLHLLGDNLTSGSVFAQGSNGYALTAQDIAKLTPGNSNYTFSLSNGNGIIKLTGTAAEEVLSLKGAYAEDGQIVLYGQQVGDPYYIYSINGQLIKSGVVKTNKETYQIEGKGVFVVKCGKNSYKVVCVR